MGLPAQILVIDDELAMRNLISEALTQEGYVVSQAANGCEGLERVHARAPDLIITDIVMPLLDGIELIMALSREGWNMPVIAMTGVPPDAVPYLRIARRLGAVRTLRKPFTISELMEVVTEALAPFHAAANADSPGHRNAPRSSCHRGQVQEEG